MFVFSSLIFADTVIHTDEMYTPKGMCYDSKNQRVIFVDYDGNAVYELSLNGFKVKKIAGKSLGKNAYGLPVGGYRDGKAEEALFKNPSDVALLSSGAIIVADTGNHAIRQIYDGKVTTIAGGKKEGFFDGYKQVAEFRYPSGLFVHNDTIYVADTENNRIRKILSNGKVETIDVEIERPSGLYVLNRDIYVTSMHDHTIYVLEKEKKLISLGKGKSEDTVFSGYTDGRLELAQFFAPSDVFLYKDQIFVADSGNHAIRKISNKNIDKDKKIKAVQTIVGGKVGFFDEKNKKLLLDTPKSILVFDNRIFIADTGNGRILILDNMSKLDPIVRYETCENPKTVYIYIDGSKLESEKVAPIIVNGKTYLPVRLLMEGLGGEIKWLADEKAVLCKYGEIQLKIKDSEYIVRANSTFVPVRYVVEKFGLTVNWNGEYRAVIINTY